MPVGISINIGQRFPRLVVISPAGSNRYGRLFECRCDCGRITIVSFAALHRGGKKSCGCLKTIHRMSRSPEFQAWTDLKRRCCDPGNASYRHYGGKGIAVAPEWANDFVAFYAYVGPRPSNRHSVDRYPNREGNYEPGNVRWATLEQQNQNKSDNVWVTFHGETLLIKDSAQRVDMKA